MKNLLYGLLAALCLSLSAFASAGADGPLPTLVPVSFEETHAPADLQAAPADLLAPLENAYGEDGGSYHDDSIDVQIHEIRAYDTPVYIAFVQISDPSQLRTDQAAPYPSQRTTNVRTMAKRVKAVLASNADYFIYHKSGIIYRQGKLLRERASSDFEGLAIDEKGDFHLIIPVSQEGFDAIEAPIVNSFCFGPALVKDGRALEIVNRAVTYRQRLAIGQLGKLTYVLVATDGPDEKDSVGLSVPQLAQLMEDLGCETAYNLDGGVSTTMYFNSEKVNGDQPLRFRAVGDIVYFVTLDSER